MAFLADEHTSNHRNTTTDREYLCFALLLIALLLFSVGSSKPVDLSERPVSFQWWQPESG